MHLPILRSLQNCSTLFTSISFSLHWFSREHPSWRLKHKQIHRENTYKYLFLLEIIYITNAENIMLIRITIVIYEIGIECYALQVKTRRKYSRSRLKTPSMPSSTWPRPQTHKLGVLVRMPSCVNFFFPVAVAARPVVLSRGRVYHNSLQSHSNKYLFHLDKEKEQYKKAIIRMLWGVANSYKESLVHSPELSSRDTYRKNPLHDQRDCNNIVDWSPLDLSVMNRYKESLLHWRIKNKLEDTNY